MLSSVYLKAYIFFLIKTKQNHILFSKELFSFCLFFTKKKDINILFNSSRKNETKSIHKNNFMTLLDIFF